MFAGLSVALEGVSMGTTTRCVCATTALVFLLVAACSGDDGTTVPGATTTSNSSSGSTGGNGTEGCPAEMTDCNGYCVDTSYHPSHCGSCNSACESDEVCDNGSCALICAGGSTECGDSCVDIKIDAKHCGGCDNACPEGELCQAGSCVLICGGGTDKCGKSCVDLSSNKEHCGACDAACAAGEACDGGKCCLSGQTNCSDTCADLNSDPSNCGSCGTKCGKELVCIFGSCKYPTNCKTLHDSFPNYTSGGYSVDPDGNGPIVVYCDMTEDAGGWTLIARFSNADAQNWMQLSGEWWYTKTGPEGATTSATDNNDMFTPAFATVIGSELKITRSDKGDGFLLKTTNNCLDGQSFRTKITKYGNFQNGAVWGSNEFKGSCEASFGGVYLTTFGFVGADPQLCTNPIDGMNRIRFWNDWEGDGSVMMIGGAGDTCMRAEHGIGVTELSEGQFGGSKSQQLDFGDEGDANPSPFFYSLNLFVR